MGIKMNLGILVEKVKLTFWIKPTSIVVCILFLLYLSFQIPNESIQKYLGDFLSRQYSSEGARLILSTIGTALMTVIGVLLSLSIVVLQQVSNQYSPRVIETFIRSRSTQFMLGFYIGTFLLCLLTLRTIPSGDDGQNVPQAPLTFAIFLAFICTAFLIHYIDHLANSIKSTSIITSIRDESIKYSFAYKGFITDCGISEKQLPEHSSERFLLRIKKSGYFQSFNPEGISKLLKNTGSIVVFQTQPGNYLYHGEVIAVIESEVKISESTSNQLLNCFQIGEHRTHVQDVRFGVRQLVDIALRALSPGINDPSTAIECLNSIGNILIHFKEHGNITGVIALKGAYIKVPIVSLDEMIDLGTTQIRQSGANHKTVLDKINEILIKISKASTS